MKSCSSGSSDSFVCQAPARIGPIPGGTTQPPLGCPLVCSHQSAFLSAIVSKINRQYFSYVHTTHSPIIWHSIRGATSSRVSGSSPVGQMLGRNARNKEAIWPASQLSKYMFKNITIYYNILKINILVH